MNKIARLDHRYLWHPFTQMRGWLKREPIVIESGQGAVLRDINGREYLDANSSIWTNLHGHRNPKIDAAIARQLKKISHSSALGLANGPAALLAERLVKAVNPRWMGKDFAPPMHPVRVTAPLLTGQGSSPSPPPAGGEGRGEEGRWFHNATPHPGPLPFGRGEGSQDLVAGHPAVSSASQGPARPAELAKVFFSDDGSTAMEAALKLAHTYALRSGQSKSPKFLSLQGAYHGDTIGAVALGHIDLFHKTWSGLLFKSDRVMAPYCYRCPFNRAKPERADARDYRKCNHECVDLVEQKFAVQKRKKKPYSALVVEPLMQGAAGMIPQPPGWLRRVAEITRGHGAQLIADEVMTGFGRTGQNPEGPASLFACHREGVQPDFMALAKGLTGGYLPMAATLTTQRVFDAFLGDYDEFKTFFHGHSYTGNQLASAAALASLDLLQSRASIQARARLEKNLAGELQPLWEIQNIGDIRQVGLIAGIELVRDWCNREPFDLREQAGIRVCDAMARRGVLTRPIGNVIVLMPPYCSDAKQVRHMAQALAEAVLETFPNRRKKNF